MFIVKVFLWRVKINQLDEYGCLISMQFSTFLSTDIYCFHNCVQFTLLPENLNRRCYKNIDFKCTSSI